MPSHTKPMPGQQGGNASVAAARTALLALTLLLADSTVVQLLNPQAGGHFVQYARLVWWAAAATVPFANKQWLTSTAHPDSANQEVLSWFTAAYAVALPTAARAWSAVALPLVTHLGGLLGRAEGDEDGAPYQFAALLAAVGIPLFCMLTMQTTVSLQRSPRAVTALTLALIILACCLLACSGASLHLPWPVASGLSLLSVISASESCLSPSTWRDRPRWRRKALSLVLWAGFASGLGAWRILRLPPPYAFRAMQEGHGVAGQKMAMEYQVLWSTESRLGGHMSVVNAWLDSTYQYRLLKVDRSLVGGMYIHPPHVAGQSIYGAFYLQDTVWLFAKGAKRALAIGLGAGLAPRALQQRGVVVDVMELHAEVARAAERSFNWSCNGKVYIGDAWVSVNRLAAQLERNAALEIQSEAKAGLPYDIIVHDVFSGGGVPASLFTPVFLHRVAATLDDRGVLALNYVGPFDDCLPYIATVIQSQLAYVRLFQDSLEAETPLKNYVFMASRRPLNPAKPAETDMLHDAQRAKYFFYLHKHEVDLHQEHEVWGPRAGSHSACFGDFGVRKVAQLHWRAMSQSFPQSFWRRITY